MKIVECFNFFSLSCAGLDIYNLRMTYDARIGHGITFPTKQDLDAFIVPHGLMAHPLDSDGMLQAIELVEGEWFLGYTIEPGECDADVAAQWMANIQDDPARSMILLLASLCPHRSVLRQENYTLS